MPRLRVPAVFLALLLLLPACAASGPAYSAAANREIGTLKGRSVRLMEKAEEDFEDHRQAAEKLLQQLAEARTRAAGRTGNGAALAMWDLLLNPEEHLLAGFLARWQEESRLGPAFISEASGLVQASFEALARLERSKVGAPE